MLPLHAPALDIADIIKQAKLGRARKEAQIDCCAVFAAALYDVLTAQGVRCEIFCAKNEGLWTHSVVNVSGRYFDSMGEFSIDIYRKRARIRPSLDSFIDYVQDVREGVFEADFDEMHAFFVEKLNEVLCSGTPCGSEANQDRPECAQRP